MAKLLVVALLAVLFAYAVFAELGVDVSDPVSQSAFSCLKSQKGVGFAMYLTFYAIIFKKRNPYLIMI